MRTSDQVFLSIVAVHGLNGHRESTWTAQGSQTNWLRDLLPVDIPNTRILSYGYNSRTHKAENLSLQSIYEHAITLLQDLCTYRRNTKVRRQSSHCGINGTSIARLTCHYPGLDGETSDHISRT